MKIDEKSIIRYDDHIEFKMDLDFSEFLKKAGLMYNSKYDAIYTEICDVLDCKDDLSETDFPLEYLLEEKAIKLSNHHDGNFDYNCFLNLVEDGYFKRAIESTKETDPLTDIYTFAAYLAYKDFINRNVNIIFINKLLNKYKVNDINKAFKLIEKIDPIDSETNYNYIYNKEYLANIREFL